MSDNKEPYKYFDSNVDSLGTFPVHWSVVRLKTAVDLRSSRVNEWTDENYVGLENIESWTGRLIDSGSALFTDDDGDTNNSVASKFYSGDVLFGKLRPYLAKAFLATFEGVCTSELIVMIPRPYIEGRFLLYVVLDSVFIDLVNSATFGVKMPRANWAIIGNMPIPLPPLPEQRAIADFLDRETAKIDALIARKQRLLELLAERKQALITHVVTKGLNPDVPMTDSGAEWLGEIPSHWKSEKLKYYTSKIGSGKTPRGGAEVYVDDGILFIRSQNVYFDGLRLDDVAFIDQDTNAEMASTRVMPNDVLLNITGASIGRCAHVPSNFKGANVNQHVCIVRPRHELIDSRFLHLVISSDVVQRQVFANETGVSREGLNFEQIGNLWIAIPTLLNEQREIVDHVKSHIEKIVSLQAKVNRVIERLLERRTALIREAITGILKMTE